MNSEQLMQHVTIHFGPNDEYYQVDHLELANDQEEDRLDDGHPFLVVYAD
jgi:hypothetical protein